MGIREMALLSALGIAMAVGPQAVAAHNAHTQSAHKDRHPEISTKLLHAPTPFLPTYEHLMRQEHRIDTLTHTIFADGRGYYEMTERMPRMLKRLAFEYYLATQVRSDEIVFTTNSDTPIATFTLPEGSAAHKAWSAEGNTGKRRAMMMRIAETLIGRMEHDLEGSQVTAIEGEAKTVKRFSKADIGYRIGLADSIADAVQRVKPYAPYFIQHARNEGLDPYVWCNIITETNFDVNLVSDLGYEGPFQLGRDEARREGLMVPEPKVIKHKKGKRVWYERKEVTPNGPHINESFNPLLAVHASMPTKREYSLMTGSLTSGISAYHTGAGNIYGMRAIYLPETDVERSSDLGAVIAAHYGWPITDFAPFIDREDAPLSLVQQSWMIRIGWKMPFNKTSYKIASSKYLPQTMANMQLMRETPIDVPAFTADQVTMQYSGRPVKVSELLALFSGFKEFKEYNPQVRHLAEGKDFTIPEGARIFVPLGASQRLFEQFSGRVRRTQPVVYNGTIAPLEPRGPPTPADIEYSRIAQLRLNGMYGAVTDEHMRHVRDLIVAEPQTTSFRRSQSVAAKLDVSFFDEGIYDPFRGGNAMVMGR